MSGRDRSFALRLLRETTVWRARVDRALARYCSRPLETLDPLILAALRAGATQLLILGTPAHAAVSETVNAVARHRGRGMVNAVLRRLAEEGEPDLSAAGTAIRYSHPEDLVERWMTRFGEADTLRLMDWNNTVPTLGGYPLGGGPGVSPGLYLTGYGRLRRTGSSPMDQGHEGLYIQDESAALVGRACSGLANGGSVLEIGAAPGGKTHHLQTGSRFVAALDSDPERLSRLSRNSRRLGWRNVLPVAGDGTSPPFRGSFGMVLLDAPCTNTGVYRRRPDARWNWSSGHLNAMVSLQRALLGSAAELVAPGGVLVYSTCSLEEEENRGQVRAFSSRRSDFRPEGLEAPAELVTDGMISIFPPEHGIDGLFAAAWRREI